MANYEAEIHEIEEWLMHPNELGSKPSKIQFVKEFTDEEDIHCLIFKFKKSIISPWMLIIHSDAGIFSELQKYNEATAVEDARGLVEYLKQFWKNRAKEEEEKRERAENLENCHGFVLMKEPVFSLEEFETAFKNDWEIDLKAAEGDKDADAQVYAVDDMRLVIGYMDFKIPNEEAEYWAKFNFLWDNAVEETATHKAHAIVTVIGDGTPQEKAILYTKAVTTLCKHENIIGVYADEIVHEAKRFVEVSEIMKDDMLPIFNVVWFGLSQAEEGISGYTCGMKHFGKDEMEIVGSKHKPSQVSNMLIYMARYVIEQDVIFHDGETVGLTANQRLTIVKSEGVNVEGESLKIAY